MKWTRRNFLKTGAAAIMACPGCADLRSEPDGAWVNDVHSQLNRTRVARLATVDSTEALREIIRVAARKRQPVCVAGGRHAMGAQQFATDAVLIDTTRLNRVLNFDAEAGTVEVEAGIQWPELVSTLHARQADAARPWGIAQKQTGADRLSLGGALAANIHGRGLRMKPFGADVESLVLVDAKRNLHTCDRRQNAEWFRLAVGGYGLFGVVCSLKLRLVPRQKVQRTVEIRNIEELMSAFNERIRDGFLYGDFQFSIDEKSDDFLQRGVFSCYRPVGPETPLSAQPRQLTSENWLNLLHFAHTDRRRVFEEYSKYYLSTSGQVYWSDTHQLSTYTDDYHKILDQRLATAHRATEVITEIYVSRERLADFMAEAREDFRRNKVEVIYGTIRLIERDEESFLAWARQPFACVIFNLHTVHSPDGLQRSADAFRRLIDMAIRRSGSYYLTYHKHATREQVLACYPQFPEFLRLKRQYDPDERFQSEWYRHYRQMFPSS